MTDVGTRGSAHTELDPALRPWLRAYRVVAYVVGVLLLGLTAGMVLKYGFDEDTLIRYVAQAHGFGYMVYLVVSFGLARRAGWSLRGTVLVLLAGTIPFLSFVAERIVTRRVTTGASL